MSAPHKPTHKPYGQTSEKSTELVSSLFDKRHLSGTKYKGPRSGLIASSLDADINTDARTVKQRNLGKGNVTLEIKRGNMSEGLDIGGHVHYAKADGTITITDGGVVHEMVEQEKERRAYLEDMIEKCSMSDEICAHLCGFDSVAQLNALLGKGGHIDDSIGGKLDADMLEANGMPSEIEVLAEDSVSYSRAIKKLKLFVQSHLPAVTNMTDKSTVNQK